MDTLVSRVPIMDTALNSGRDAWYTFKSDTNQATRAISTRKLPDTHTGPKSPCSTTGSGSLVATSPATRSGHPMTEQPGDRQTGARYGSNYCHQGQSLKTGADSIDVIA